MGCSYNKMFVCLPNSKKLMAINTLEMGSGPPLVLLHGFAGALGFWIKNLPQLSRKFTVYAIDLLGWGRSLGPKLKVSSFKNSELKSPQAKSEAEAEDFFLSSFESWREALSIKQFYIVGHSLGSYIACCYAMQHPDRVKGMVLLEPWGFFDAPDSSEYTKKILSLNSILVPRFSVLVPSLQYSFSFLFIALSGAFFPSFLPFPSFPPSSSLVALSLRL
jgi:pimeloyl-ACP methyl ester carboxylesterase